MLARVNFLAACAPVPFRNRAESPLEDRLRLELLLSPCVVSLARLHGQIRSVGQGHG
jgi:hypothetical protein